jgi:tRNA(Ile)-lysidine synthase
VPVTDRIETQFLQGLGAAVNAPLGLAVSGGGDSVALLHLAVAAGVSVQAVTVDHGLRAEAAAEAAAVGVACARLGVPHDILRWHWDGDGNLQDQARRARLRMMADWAQARGIGAVALGHTQDDVAETFLMRLARGAGVDGLAAMAPSRMAEGILWLRPLLGVARADLRDWLSARGIGWAEDPSNANDRFDRVKARRALAALKPLGLGPQRLAEVAGHLAEVRAALEDQARAAAAQVARIEAGDVLFDAAGFGALCAETQRRLLVAAVQWINSAEYGPRGADIIRLRDALAAGKPATLAGCRLTVAKGVIRAMREARAVQDVRAAPGEVWDHRWIVSGPENNSLEIRALGADGLLQCPDWRATGRARASLLASPAVWRGTTLVAAPLAGLAMGWRAECRAPKGVLSLVALSH